MQECRGFCGRLEWGVGICHRFDPLYASQIQSVSQARPRKSLVHPFSLTPITQSGGRSSEYQVDICSLPFIITIGGKLQPEAQTHSIAVTYSRLPGCTETGFPALWDSQTTLVVVITPIWKPVLSKLKISLSTMLYLALIFCTSQNQLRIIAESLHLARW